MNFSKWIMQESGFSHVRRMLMGDVPQINSIGIVTAQNPAGQQGKKADNKEANKQLLSWLRSANYGPIKAKGKFFGTKEESFIVPNITRDDVVTLGHQFGQESVIWGDKQADEYGNPHFRFEYIEGGKTINVRSVHIGRADVQNRDDLYTMIKGRKFIIPFFGDEYSRKIPGQKYGTVVNTPDDPDATNLAQVETFYIPFFDDYESTELEFFGELSYYSDHLNNCPYVNELVSEIKHREEMLQIEDRTGKSYWMHRGVLQDCMDKLRCL